MVIPAMVTFLPLATVFDEKVPVAPEVPMVMESLP